MIATARTSPLLRCRKVMDVVDSLGAVTGSADARDPKRIVVRFPTRGLGDIGVLTRTACGRFKDAGFQPLTMNVNDNDAQFVIEDVAA